MTTKFLILGKACGRRQEEIAQVRRFLLANDWKESRSLGKADLVVFFGCAGVRSIVDANVKEIAETQERMKPGAELVVGSCLPAIDGESLRRVFDGKTITPTDLSPLNMLPNVRVRIEEMPKMWGRDASCLAWNRGGLAAAARRRIEGAAMEGLGRAIERRPAALLKRTALRLKKRNTVNLSIAAGCPRKCAYCARPQASGAVRSKPTEVVVENIRKGIRMGYRGFNLYADSIGSYGLDLGVDLGALLDRILEIDGRFTLGLYDVHAQDFARFFEPIERLCRAGRLHYLYVAVQSGNERVLGLMKRPCDVGDLAAKLAEIRKRDGVFMQSTIIVGFPGETDEEFEDTVRLLKRIEFDDVYVHCYCDMPGTEASRLSSKVDRETVRRRLLQVRRAGIHHDVEEARREWEGDLARRDG